MRVLITGKGSSGSWKIRGEQLGQAIGAEIQPLAEPSDCRSADVVVGVKRIPDAMLRAIHSSDRPFVWDAVDPWPQPTNWGQSEATQWLCGEIARLQPDAVVFGTEQMHVDSGFTGPALVLPHHAWEKYVRSPVRPARVVGYEGAEPYLGRWRPLIEHECAKRGWVFRVNGDMSLADIGIALRDGGGYPARWWKPGTKLANLQALGIPALCSEEAGCREIASGTETWIGEDADLPRAFDALSDLSRRRLMAEQMHPPRLRDVALRYKTFLAACAR